MEYFFANREEASRAAADFIAERLRGRLGGAADAALVVSGGTTPVRCFERLSATALPWSRVRVLMSDERWVAPDDHASNEKLVRTHLLQGNAAAATLVPVYRADSSPEARCAALGSEFGALPRPFACTLLGMGGDGHIASLFPDAHNLAGGLDLDGSAGYIPVTTAASPLVRISMTLPALLDSIAVLLLIFGADKRDVYEAAHAGDRRYPVTALLSQERTPVHVFWAA